MSTLTFSAECDRLDGKGRERVQEFRRVNQFALLMIGVMLFGSTLVSTVLNWLGSDSLLVKYILLYGIQFVLPIVGFCITDRGQSPRELMRLRRPKGYTFVLTIFFAVAIQPFLMCISSLTSLIFHNYLNDSMVKYMEEPLGITLLAVAVIPAFCEELLCRGIYLSGCKRLNIYLAAILGGIFFGVLHMNPQQAVYAAVFGFLCSMIVMGADSIWPAMLAHLIINGAQILLAYVQSNGLWQSSWLKDLSDWLLQGETLWQILPTAILLLGVAVWCLIRIFYIEGRQELLKGRIAEKGQKPLTVSEAFSGYCWLGGTVLAFLLICMAVGIQ